MPRRRLPDPRWQTPLDRSIVAGSWGPDVERWAHDELGLTFDRWQRRAVNRALAYTADGCLIHRHYLISTGRQNGKTVIVRSIIGWALTARSTPPWSMLLGLAHDRGQARIPYTAVLADLEHIRRRSARGSLALTRYLGIRSDLYGRHREYHTGSAESRNTIRGQSNDLGVFDEVRTQVNYDTWAALEPTTRARPDPLIIALSTAGDDRSIVLRDWWDRGRRIIDGVEPADGFGMTWYAAADDLAHDDPRAILQANPAVAEGRLPIGPVAASIRSLSPATYRAETLNLWTDGADEWLPPGVWLRQVAPQPDTRERVILGVEAVPSWRRVTVTVAIANADGAWVGVAGEIDSSRTQSSSVSPAELVQLVARLAKEWTPAQIVYSRQAAAGPHLESWATEAGVAAVPMTGVQLRAASSLFRSELIGGRLFHPEDALLAQQVRSARPNVPLEGGDWYFGIRQSLGEIDALRAAAWASWAAIAPQEAEVPVQVFL